MLCKVVYGVVDLCDEDCVGECWVSESLPGDVRMRLEQQCTSSAFAFLPAVDALWNDLAVVILPMFLLSDTCRHTERHTHTDIHTQTQIHSH